MISKMFRFARLKATFYEFSKSQSAASSNNARLKEDTEWKRDIEAYFLGPVGENSSFLKKLTLKAIDEHHLAREMANPGLHHITKQMQNKQ